MKDYMRERAWNAITSSTALSEEGDMQRSLEVLDNFISEAMQENRIDCVELVTSAAVVMADAMGDLQRVRHYHEQLLAQTPDNSKALYGLASVLSRMGQADLAKQYAARCYKLSTEGGHALDAGFLELILKQWPELNQ